MKKICGLCCVVVLALVFCGFVTFAKEANITKTSGGNVSEVSLLSRDTQRYSYVYPFRCLDILEPVIELKENVVALSYGTEYDLASNVSSCCDLFDGDCKFVIIGTYDKYTPNDYEIRVVAQDSSKNQAEEFYIIRVLPNVTKLTAEEKNAYKEAVSKDAEKNVTSATAVKTNIASTESKTSVSTEANIKSHDVNTGNAKIYRPYTDQFYDAMSLIKEDVTRFDIKYLQSITEIDYLLLGSLGVGTSVSETLGGPVIGVEIKADYVSALKDSVFTYEEAQNRYQTFIKHALYGMDLYTTDKDLVDQINAYIVRTFSYSITNEKLMSSFTDTKKGQCMHYARLFSDMCKAAGISCTYIEGYANGESHAFNRVAIDGVNYYFDVSWNDVCGERNAYSWLSESELRKTHSW